MQYKIEKLIEKWIKDETKYRSQVAEAMQAETPFAGMLAHADQLQECRRALQVAAGIVKGNPL